ncbi:MAG: ATP-binding protein [Proteobacteria bacterium]|nr:ATP-binding protein [Pseudomonadota bacterium]
MTMNPPRMPLMPRNPALTHLDLELEWLRAKLTVRIREMQSRGLLPGAEELQPGTVIYVQEVEARLHERDQEATDPTKAELEAKAELLDIEEKRDAFYQAHEVFDIHTPLAFLRQHYHLTDAQYLLFLMVIAPVFNPSFPRLYAFVQNNFERQYPTLALFIEVFSPDKDCGYLNDLISPQSPLISEGLVILNRIASYLPDNAQPLTLPSRIQAFIAGQNILDPSLAAFSELRQRDQKRGETLLSLKQSYEWTTRIKKLRTMSNPPWQMPVCYVTGQHGAGKRRFAQDVAAILNKDLLCVDIKSLYSTYDNFSVALSIAIREAILHDAVLCLFGWEKLILPTTAEDANFHAEISALHLGVCRILDACLAWLPSTIIITCQNSVSFTPRLETRNVEVFRLTYPDHTTSLALWQQMLPAELRDDQCDLKAYAENFHLTPGQIKDAVEEAYYLSQPADKVNSETIIGAVKDQMRHRLSEHATLLDKKYRWEDLIVPKDVEIQLKEIIYRYQYRAKVLTEWGLGDRFGHDIGLSALFDGPPGTGKSMCASLIANEIGIDVYQVDLSRVMSKYVGETEKNLAQIFNEAENAQAMLLFDECDSLFGQRTNVKNSNDKYANLEVNYLLQRIERYPGVAILTTNFPAGIDEAFARRLSLRVSFPKPSKADRARLWQSMLKTTQLPKGKIDYRELATEFEISGGYIKNAILRAAFMAASQNTVVDQDILYQAARIEMKSQGMLVSQNDAKAT